jgi:hypothetical protein
MLQALGCEYCNKEAKVSIKPGGFGKDSEGHGS